MKPKFASIVLNLAATFVVACTVNSTTNNSGNTCGQDTSVTCSEGGSGYSCSGSDSPDQDDSTLDCSAGVTDGANTDYCCITITSGSTCSPDSNVEGCASGSYGFSCTGSDTPDTANSSLTCSSGTPGSGETSYCCCTGSDCDNFADAGTDDGSAPADDSSVPAEDSGVPGDDAATDANDDGGG